MGRGIERLLVHHFRVHLGIPFDHIIVDSVHEPAQPRARGTAWPVLCPPLDHGPIDLVEFQAVLPPPLDDLRPDRRGERLPIGFFAPGLEDRPSLLPRELNDLREETTADGPSTIRFQEPDPGGCDVRVLLVVQGLRPGYHTGHIAYG